MTWMQIIFWILLIDSVAANIVAWFGRKWYMEHLRFMTRFFPPAKGWTAYYLVLVLIIGYLLY